ncbi:MAG: hypothetical protein IJA41_07035 [Clostridia bacterium]|nr:hypothetical protein [Clostridia bacterium]
MKKKLLLILVFVFALAVCSSCSEDSSPPGGYLKTVEIDTVRDHLDYNNERYYLYDSLDCPELDRLQYMGKVSLKLILNDFRTNHSVYVYPNAEEPLFFYCEEVGVFADLEFYNPADDYNGLTEYSGVTVATVNADLTCNDETVYKTVKNKHYDFKEALNFKTLFTGKVIEFSTVRSSKEYRENEHLEFYLEFSDDIPLVKKCKAYSCNGAYHIAYFDFFDGLGISGYDDDFYFEINNGVLDDK